ncbi:MAG: hypothetical protein U9Q69_00745 [Nanoarchaeota archaeon]|nr:hypothetical protein [Nanoarchaeota archaeon]
MKKIIALLIIALIGLSMVPIALATKANLKQEERGLVAFSGKSVNLQKLKQLKNLGDEAKALAQNGQKLIKQGKDLIKTGKKIKSIAERKVQKLKELNEFKEKNKIIRPIPQNKLQGINNNFLMAKERYNKAKQNFNKEQLRLDNAKKVYNICKDEPESEDCLAAKEELKEAWKGKLLQNANIIIEHLNKIEAKIESNEQLSEEQIESYTSWIKEKTNKLEEIKTKIQNASNKEELISSAKTLKKLWGNIKIKSEGLIGRIVTNAFSGTILQAKTLEVKLDQVLEKLQDEGKDISEVNAQIEDFHSEINNAIDSFQNAKEIYKDLSEEKIADEDAKMKKELAKDYVKNSKESLVKARTILRNIINHLKGLDAEKELEIAKIEI